MSGADDAAAWTTGAQDSIAIEGGCEGHREESPVPEGMVGKALHSGQAIGAEAPSVLSAAAIGHIDVHGHLAAHPNRCEAANARAICHQLSDFILDLIRDDFARRLAVARNTT